MSLKEISVDFSIGKNAKNRRVIACDNEDAEFKIKIAYANASKSPVFQKFTEIKAFESVILVDDSFLTYEKECDRIRNSKTALDA